MTEREALEEEEADAPARRRNFLIELTAFAIGGVITLFGFISGLVVFLDPLGRAKHRPRAFRKGDGSGREGFVRVATIDSLPEDGTPRFFPVVADRMDAWNYYPSEPVGSVFLRRVADEAQVMALHSTCPHLGCTLGYAEAHQQFRCPCHESAFTTAGDKIDIPGKINPSPRNMDELEIDQQQLETSGEIWIRFVNFHTGKEEQIPKV